MSEKQVRDYDKFMLRFPDGMRDAIAERARRNGRSMNSEIVQILEDALTLPAVKVQSEFNVDLYAENPADNDKVTMSKRQLLEMVNRSVQHAIDTTADSLSKSVAEATFNALSEKYDFVLKSKKR